MTFWASAGMAAAVVLVMGIGAALAYLMPGLVTEILVVPFGLAAITLLVALVGQERLHRSPAMMVTHASLLVLVLLVGVSRMTYLKGWVEVATGEWFEGRLMGEERGPWHGGDLDRVRFQNLGFEVQHSLDGRRRETVNQVAWQDDHGHSGTLVMGDNRPLVLAGYRFLTSGNKGYAPVFLYWPQGGEPIRGTVNLPSFPLFSGQSNTWQLPGHDQTWLINLQFDGPFPPADRAWVFPGRPDHHLVITAEGKAWEMRPGETRQVVGGRLVYEGLGSWMGYRVFYDGTMLWQLACALVAVAGLVGHWVNRLDQGETDGE